MSSVREPGKYSINLSDRDLDELDKLASATKGQDAQTKKWGYTAILNDVLQRTDTAIDIQKESQAYMQTRVKYMSGFVVVMALLLIANFALTLSAVEMSKESHVKKNSLTDKGGSVVQVGSSDFNLGSGGELVQRSPTSTRAPVGTAPVLSKYKLSSRIPNKYMEELDAFTVSTSCAKDSSAAECDNTVSTMKATVRSFKRVPREGSHCGSVVVFQTDVGEFTLDDSTLFQGSAKMTSVEGVFSLGSRRLANMNISAHGRQLMEQGAAPAVDSNLHGSFKFLANVKAEEFVCKMGGVIGDEFTVQPPVAPPVPYTYIVLKETTCTFGETKDNACDSELTQGLKPGVAQYSNFTTMRSYEQVLLTQTHRVVVSYFASQPLSRLIQVLHLQSQVVTQYLNYRKSKSKLSCLVKPVEGAKKTKETNADVHLAYLSTAVDEGLTSMRWALSPYSAQGTIFPLYTEYWERLGSRMPRRLFLKGDLVIAPKVSVDLFVTPMEFLFFQASMTDDEVGYWYATTIFQNIKNSVLCPAQEPAGVMPGYLGPFGEAGARWVASQLVSGDLDNYGSLIIWPGSYYKYWNAVVAGLDTPSLAGSTVGRKHNIIPPKSSGVDGGVRRLEAGALPTIHENARSGTAGRTFGNLATISEAGEETAGRTFGNLATISEAGEAGAGEAGAGEAGKADETKKTAWYYPKAQAEDKGGWGTRRRGQAAANFQNQGTHEDGFENHRRRDSYLRDQKSAGYADHKGDTWDEKLAMREAKDIAKGAKTPAPTPSKNKLQSAADMEEFTSCTKSAKDCFSKKGNSVKNAHHNLLRRLSEAGNGATGQTWGGEDIDGNLCETMARQALGLGGQPCLGWDCKTKNDFGKAMLYKTSGKALASNLQDVSLELACGPCSISLSVAAFKKKIPIPTFACIFTGGSGCYWKAAGGGFKLMPDMGLWEKFATTSAASYVAPSIVPGLEVGDTIALHSANHKRFMRMNGGQDMDGSSVRTFSQGLGPGWQQERFLVVDGGNGQVALWSHSYGRFVRMNDKRDMDASSPKGKNELPNGWTWERFEPVDAGNGKVAFYSRSHKRYIRMLPHAKMDASSTKNKASDLPAGWGWERFRIQIVSKAVVSGGDKYKLNTHNGAYLIASGAVLSSAANLAAADKVKKKAIWNFNEQMHHGRGRWFVVNDDNNKAIMDKRGYVALTGGRGQKERWRLVKHNSGKKYSLENDWRKFWLSAPGGEYGCKICINLISESAGKKLGVQVRICFGMSSDCWFFVEIIGERVPPPRWANMMGVQVSVAGYLKLCVWPFAVSGWIELKITKGFCKSILGFVATFAIYGGLKFEFEYKLGQGAILTGSAYIGVAGGVYRAGWGGGWGGGRRRRRRRRRREKCRCGRVAGDGSLDSCPRKAGADGRLTFTLKMWPCQKGVDANLMAKLGFSMSLDLFGIKINLPKVKDIELFKTKVKKPFGR